MNLTWMLGCCIIALIVSQVCASSIMPEELYSYAPCTEPSGYQLDDNVEMIENCDMEHGNVCSVQCKDGFEPEDPYVTEGPLQCKDGKWEKLYSSDNFTCRKFSTKSCTIPSPYGDNLEIYEETCELGHGKFCSVKCKEGFQPEDPDVSGGLLQCIDGKWGIKSNIICRVSKSCIQPPGYEVGDPFVVTGNCRLEHGKICSVKCIDGLLPMSYSPNVTEGRFRCIDGLWEDYLQERFNCIAPASCTKPSPYNLGDDLEITENCQLEHGKFCFVKCKKGFQPEDPYVSDNRLECVNGKWREHNLNITCRESKSCTIPSAYELGDNLEITENCKLEHGKFCSVKCKKGFHPEDPYVSEGRLHCLHGNWSEYYLNITCLDSNTEVIIIESKKCLALQIPNSAKDPACSESDPDQECTVVCQDNFDLDGEGKIKCDITGKWSREPKCNQSERTLPRGGSGQKTLTKITNNSCKNCIIVNT